MSKRFVDVLLGARPLYFAAGAFGFGLVVLLWGVSSYADTKFAMPGCPPGTIKAVGFGFALNWSVNMLVVFPAIVYGLLVVIQRMCQALDDLVQSGMVVNQELARVKEEEVAAAWRRQLQTGVKWLAPLVLAGFAYSVYEWYQYSGDPLRDQRIPFNENRGELEGDWSIAAILDDSGRLQTAVAGPARLLNALFSLVCFLTQGVWISFFGLAIWLVILMSGFLLNLSRHRGEFRVVPDVRSADARRGFERFEGLVEYSLLTLGLFYLMFFLSRTWNEYLRTCDVGLGSFVRSSYSAGGWSLNQFHLDYSSTRVAFGALILMVLALLMMWMVLRQAARDARDFLSLQTDAQPERVAAIAGMPVAQIKQRLANMIQWPLGYLSATSLLVILVLATISIFIYQLGPISAAALLGWRLLSGRVAKPAAPEFGDPTGDYGEDFARVRDALVAAFPTPAHLEQFISFRLSVNLHRIARDGDLEVRVFDVIQWAGAEGKLKDLVKGARTQNPDSPPLKALDDATVERVAAALAYNPR